MPENSPIHGKTLGKVPLFAGLSESELAFLVDRVVTRRYSAGESVFSEGEPCTGLYVAGSGSVPRAIAMEERK